MSLKISARAAGLLLCLVGACVDLAQPPEIEACRGGRCPQIVDAAAKAPDAVQGGPVASAKDAFIPPTPDAATPQDTRVDAAFRVAIDVPSVVDTSVLGDGAAADMAARDVAVSPGIKDLGLDSAKADMSPPHLLPLDTSPSADQAPLPLEDAASPPPDAPADRAVVPIVDAALDVIPDVVQTKTNGVACSTARECNSGFCVAGICCDGDCTGSCRSCALSGSLGACRPHPAGTSCGPAVCAAGVESAARTCDGQGACPVAIPRACLVNELCQGTLCTVNGAPVVNAGANQTKPTVSGKIVLAGSATDDGIPTPALLSLLWTKVSGPGDVTFDAADSATTPVAFSAVGIYLLRLTANDGAAAAQKDVTFTVLGLDQGLAGHWRFDEGSGSVAADTSGGNNHATLSNGPAWTPGRFNGALDVSAGDTEYGVVADPPDGRLDFGTGDFSVSLWMQTPQVPVVDVNYPEILNKWEYVTGGRFGYEIFTGYWQGKHQTSFKIWSAPDVISVEVTDLNDGLWHHVVGRKTATKIQIFSDGVMRTEVTHAFGTVSGQAPVQIGGYEGAGWADFDGKIDDIRIYNRALGDLEISTLTGASP